MSTTMGAGTVGTGTVGAGTVGADDAGAGTTIGSCGSVSLVSCCIVVLADSQLGSQKGLKTHLGY